MAIAHVEAARLIADGARRYLAREPTQGEIDAALAVGGAETGYGSWWKRAGVGSNNWGAITCTRPNAQECFPHGDVDAGRAYSTFFRIYPTPAAGAADVAREVLRRPGVLDAANRGDLLAVAAALFDSRYYRPRTATQSREHRIGEYAGAMDAALGRAEAGGVPRVLRLGAPAPAPGPEPEPEPSAPGSGSAGGALLALAALGALAFGARGRRWKRA